MPQVVRKDDLLTVSYITGPRCVWLGVKFVRDPVAEPKVVKRPPIGTCSHGEIDQGQRVAAVVAGSQDYGLHVERIEYVENDSPAYSLYARCARPLAEHAGSAEA